MIMAFIMAKVVSSKAREVLEVVRMMENVQETYLIYGAYDLLVKDAFKTPKELSEFVVDRLRKVDGIMDTVTNVCASCD